MSLAIFYVYILFRPWDGSPFYVGKGKGDRWLHHRKLKPRFANKYFLAIIKKARKLGLEIPYLKIRDNLTEEEAFEIEAAFIAAIGRGNDGPLVNATDGGEGTAGFSRSSEWRAQMSRIMTGKPSTFKGGKHSPETIKKMRLIANQPERIAISSEQGRKNKGSKRTPEQRATLSVAHTGKVLSTSHRANIGKGNTGGKRSLETRQRMSAAQQKIADQMSEIVRERWKDPEYREKAVEAMSIAAMGNTRALGTVHSAEARANMSEGQRRRAPPTEKTRAKMSAKCKANWENPEYRAMMLETRRLKAEIRRQRRLAELEQSQSIVGLR